MFNVGDRVVMSSLGKQQFPNAKGRTMIVVGFLAELLRLHNPKSKSPKSSELWHPDFWQKDD